MATPIINTNLGKVVTATGNIADDLSTLRPLLRNMLFNAYATDKIENTPIATFPDGADNVPVKSATFGIVPQQDLHGYDSPWPAGGGKNLYSMAWALATNASVTVTASDTEIRVVTNGSAAYSGMSTGVSHDLPAGTYYIKFKVKSGGTSSTGYCGLRRRSSNNFVSPATFNASTLTYAFSVTTTEDCYFSVLGNQADTGDTAASDFTIYDLIISTTDSAFEPYSNVCPISGFTGAEITARGANLWDEEWENGYINNAGELAPDSSSIRSKNFNACRPAVSYYFVKPSVYLITPNLVWYDKNKNFIRRTDASTEFPIATAPNNAYYFKISAYGYGTTYNHDISINYPSTDTAYHASVGTTHDITWQDEAGTVYGGTIAYLGGDAWRVARSSNVATSAIFANYSLAGITAIEQVGSLTRFWLAFTGGGNPKVYGGALCDRAKYTTNYAEEAVGIGEITAYPSSVYLKLPTADVGTTAETILEYLKTSGIEIFYNLTTPVTYDLTGEELATVLGDNNVFSNTGDVTELVYRADTALFVEKKLAEA